MTIYAEHTSGQQQRLRRFGVDRCVDLHCHVLPGIDDGPQTMDEAIALCQALVEDGVTSVVATPHQLGAYQLFNSNETVRGGVAELTDELASRGIPLEVAIGGEVRIDERLLSLLKQGVVGNFAGHSAHLLLELPHDCFVDPTQLVEGLVEVGVQPIIAHPERHAYLWGHDRLLHGWVEAGAILQLTAGSLVGDFGRRVTDFSWRLIMEEAPIVVASDAHDAWRRGPCMTEAIEALEQRLGFDAAKELCLENPSQIWQGRRLAAI